jgi:hypothetical protein
MDLTLRRDPMHSSLQSGPDSTESDEKMSLVELALAPADRALLEEAMRLLGADSPSEVLRTALTELVERQRFLSWVAAHERGDRSGNA